MCTWKAPRRTTLAGAVCVALSIAAAGCAETSGSSDGGGDGVAYGATMQEYHAAFEDIEPIQLTVQTIAGPGTLTNHKEEMYIQAVEEWSDGKIQFDVTPASGIAPPDEGIQAVGEGRVDVSSVFPTYQPDTFPTYAALTQVAPAITMSGAVTTPIHSTSFTMDVAYNTPAFLEEFEKQGLHPLLPFFTGAPTYLTCTDPVNEVEDFEGIVATGSSAAVGEQIKALGGSFTSIPFTENYEALQRNVIDCAAAPPLSALGFGLFEVAPHVTNIPGIAYGGGAYVINDQKWEELPLVAQQLLFDRLDAWLIGIVDDNWNGEAQYAEGLSANGGGTSDLSPSGVEIIETYNGTLLDKVLANDGIDEADAFVERSLNSAAKWDGILTDEFDLDASTQLSEMAGWYGSTDVDLESWTQRLYQESLVQHRPE